MLFPYFHGSRRTWEKVYRDIAAKIYVMPESEGGGPEDSCHFNGEKLDLGS